MYFQANPNSRHERLYAELWEKAAEIQTAGQLYARVGSILSPLAAEVTREGLRHFARSKVRNNGVRDGHLIWMNSKQLGFGRKLKSEQQITEWLRTPSGRSKSLMLGMWMWLSSPHSVLSDLKQIDRINHAKDYGVEDPRALASIFITYIGFQEQGLPRPMLPEIFR